MKRNEVEDARFRNQEMVKIQNKITSIQANVSKSLRSFYSKKNDFKLKNQKYQQFLEGLNERAATLQKYTDELIKNEYNLSIAKTNYEIELSKIVKELRRTDRNLGNQLNTSRKKIIEICAKKTQLSAILSSLSQEISTYEEQEINLDQLFERAEMIIAKLNMAYNADPVSVNKTEMEHIKKLIEFTSQESKITESHIDQIGLQLTNSKQLFIKYQNKIENLKKIKDLTLHYVADAMELAQINLKKAKLQGEVQGKEKMIEHFQYKIDKLSNAIRNHKIKLGDSFADSRRSLNHTFIIESSHLMTEQQLKDIKKELLEIASTKEANTIEEHRLEKRLYDIENEISTVSDSHTMLTDELNSTNNKITKMNEYDLEQDQKIDNLLNEFNIVQKKIKDEILEGATLEAQIEDSAYDTTIFNLTYDADVHGEKEQMIKKIDFLQYQVDDVMKDICRYKNWIDHFQLVRNGLKAQKEKIGFDISNQMNIINECNDHFRSFSTTLVSENQNDFTIENSNKVEDLSYSNKITRHINNRVQLENIDKLRTAISRKRATIQHRKDNISSQRNSISSYIMSYYDNVPSVTETLKRSIKFAVQENPLQDRIQTLNFLIDNLHIIETSFNGQLEIWKGDNEQNESVVLDDWQIELNQLREKAEDLIIFNQVFGQAP